jgi:hypothetical protein
VEEQEKEGHCGPRTRRKERGKEGHTSTLFYCAMGYHKLMRGGKRQGRKAELAATENKKPGISGLDQRAHCL